MPIRWKKDWKNLLTNEKRCLPGTRQASLQYERKYAILKKIPAREGNQLEKKKKIKFWILGSVCAAAVAAAGILGASFYGRKQMEKIPGLTAQECLQYTLQGKADGCITVGILKDGAVTYHMYVENGAEVPVAPHTYEIGSITKTMTAALVEKAVQAGKLELQDSIGEYLGFENGSRYPTVQELLTHTSGYKPYYFVLPMIGNFLRNQNDFRGITGKMLRDRAAGLDVGEEEHPWVYSNFGYALLGQLLEQISGEDFESQMNRFLRQDLQMRSSKISDGTGDLGNYWQWDSGDAYLSAGAVTSDIEDMMHYARLQLENPQPFAACHDSVKQISTAPAQWERMGLRADAIGLSWILDQKNGFVWHNGATDHYNSYLGFCPETGTAVVVLSNLPPDCRIPATIIGPKILKEIQ